MQARFLTIIAALVALALVPSTALAAPKKVFYKFSVATASVAENTPSGKFDLTIQRSGNTAAAGSVDVSTNGGTATNGNEYSFTPVTVPFAARETTKKVSVTINDNSSINTGASNRTAIFQLTNPTAAAPATAQTKAPASMTLTIVDDEGPGLIDFSTNAYTVLEGSGVATITVSRVAASDIAESVQYLTQVPATNGASILTDYTAISTPQTLTFAPGEMSKTFQVQIKDDNLAENPEDIGLRLQNPQNLSGGAAPTLGGNNPALLTINDDDVSTYSFHSTLFSVGESAGTATITVDRGGATNLPATVNYSTVGGGTATANSDYTPTSGTLSFAAGETQKTFTVAILPDSADEPNETVNLSLSSGATAELSIVDDDAPNESVQFSDTSYSVNEADGTATITVTLSHALSVPTTVHYATSDGTARVVDGDYTAASGTLNFAAGDTQKTFTVAITNDSDPEDPETIGLTLTSPGTSLVMGDPSTATLTITDDDPPGVVDFKSLTYSASETGLVATITVERVGGVGGPVSVDYATSDGTATAGSDYTATSGTLNWANGDGADKTFTVPVAWDGRAEGPESINLSLSNPAGADLGPNTAAVLQLADDGASGAIQLSAGSYSINEANGMVTITVTRSGGSLGGPVTVDYATSDGTATAGSDYTAANGTLTFGPGEDTKTFTVPIANDSAHEDAETFQVTLSNATGGANVGTPSGASVTIGDDDAAPSVSSGSSDSSGSSTPSGSPTPSGSSEPAGTGLQSTPSNPNPEGSQTAAADTRAPKVTLSAKKIQKAFKVKLLALVAKCDENCKLAIVAKTGKGRKVVTLGKANVKTARGAKATIKVKLSKKMLAKLTKLVRRGKLAVTVSVVASDAAGNKGKAARGITIQR